MSSDIYICAFSDEQYQGSCKISRCWANIASDRHKSGCLFSALNGKSEIGVADLAFVLNQSRSEVQNQLATAKVIVKNGLELLDQVDEVRIADAKKNQCPTCGRSKSHGGKCLNSIKCNQRKDIVTWCLSHPLFRNLETPLTSYQFMMLLKNPLNIDRLAGLLKLTPEYVDTIRELANTQAPREE